MHCSKNDALNRAARSVSAKVNHSLRFLQGAGTQRSSVVIWDNFDVRIDELYAEDVPSWEVEAAHPPPAQLPGCLTDESLFPGYGSGDALIFISMPASVTKTITPSWVRPSCEHAAHQVHAACHALLLAANLQRTPPSASRHARLSTRSPTGLSSELARSLKLGRPALSLSWATKRLQRGASTS